MFDFMIPGILHALGLGPKWSICSVITLELLLKWLGFDGYGGEAAGAESLRRGMAERCYCVEVWRTGFSFSTYVSWHEVLISGR